jgi:AcrR family transcriptional regulator
VSTRRHDLLDTAIELLAERGLHGVTHRTIDTAAGVPAGSTSNYFRTREALLVAIAERFAVRERAAMEQILTGRDPTTPDELAAALAESALKSTGALRALTLARYTLLIESAVNPAIRAPLAAIGSGQGEHFQRWLKAAGSTDPGRDVSIISNHLTGLVLHQVALPTDDFDPLPSLTGLVRALIPARRRRTSSNWSQ